MNNIFPAMKLIKLFLVSLKLGLTSFGGPTAHIGYFHKEYVKKQKWIGEQEFAELVALCQLLPGPASSQTGFGIGLKYAGLIGGIVSFLGFTLPSFAAMALFALSIRGIGTDNQGWIHGLKIVAAVVVFQAVFSLGKNFASQRITGTIAALSAFAMLIFPSSIAQIGVMALAGIAGYLFIKKDAEEKDTESVSGISTWFAWTSLGLFSLLFVLLPVLRAMGTQFELFDSFFRTGALVFGGGHVVLPLLERELVPSGFISKEGFLAGYGAVQAMPGPLFTFASYLGASINGWKGAITATAAIFLPGFLLLIGVLPFWDKIRRNPSIQAGIAGMNAAVVGLLSAALYDPIMTESISSKTDAALFALFFGLFIFWKLPPWVLVAAGGLAGFLFL